VVVAVGRIVPLKQMEAIVRACSRLALRYPDLHLQIVGEGDHAPLVQLAEEPSFRNRLHVNAAESAAKYLAASDLYLSL
jgi:glycosyltransferase involved in cell wall biosynthesis